MGLQSRIKTKKDPILLVIFSILIKILDRKIDEWPQDSSLKSKELEKPEIIPKKKLLKNSDLIFDESSLFSLDFFKSTCQDLAENISILQLDELESSKNISCDIAIGIIFQGGRFTGEKAGRIKEMVNIYGAKLRLIILKRADCTIDDGKFKDDQKVYKVTSELRNSKYELIMREKTKNEIVENLKQEVINILGDL